jgi:hypothetical protein
MKTSVTITGKICILGFMLLMAGALYSQNGDLVTISGKIKDAKTKSDLYFTTVSVPNSSIATVSNSEGEFTVKFSKALNVKELEFSHLGYQKKTIALEKFTNGNTLVLLEPASINLDEITIRGLNAKQIVQEAVRNIPINYRTKPMMMTGFYRETIKQRRDYISISEAVLDVYKASYKSNSEHDRIKLFKARQGINVRKADTLGVKLQGGPNISLMLDVAKNPHILLYELQYDLYEFTIIDMVSINNKPHYIVGFTQIDEIEDPLYQGQIYIDAENFAITHAQFNLNMENKADAEKLFVRRKPMGVKFIPMSTSYLVKFTENNGKYYLSYARNELNFKAIWKKRLFNTRYSITAELAITDRDEEKVVKFSKSDTFKTTDVLAEAVSAFTDENFWGEHNTIKPEESIEEAIRKYGKRLKRNK